jgi:CheY-like chemotaxis protein
MATTQDGLSKQSTLHVLLAEDSPLHERLAVRLLQEEGHSVTVARNGMEAVEAMEDNSFDLVLMDVQMPVMDGLEATGAIRQRERTAGKRTPVIAVTATANPNECLAAGMDGHIKKPLVREVLRQTVGNVLSGRIPSENHRLNAV